jgi:hypothetical protein
VAFLCPSKIQYNKTNLTTKITLMLLKHQHKAKKMTFTIALIVIILSSWFALLDLPATERVDAGIKRALISFTTARALNAVISVAQGTEIAAQPMGVGVTLTPGQLLDPVNDLVERFSSLMLIASVALGMQKILINIGSYWPISLLLTITALRWGWVYLGVNKTEPQKPPKWLSKTLILLLMVRFAIPLVTIGTDYVFQKYLAAEYTASQKSMDLASNNIGELVEKPKSPAAEPLTEDESLWEKSKANIDNFINDAKETIDVKAHVAKLQLAAQQWAEHIVNLIVIFVLQTLCIPLLLIWFLYLGMRRLVD